MTKLFHNTANSDNSEVHEGIKRNYKQNDAILQYVKDNSIYYFGYVFDAWNIQTYFATPNKYYNKPILITSVRRSLNSLMNKGLIKKVGTTKGKMKTSNTLYEYVSDTPIFCKSIPKQIKRTPEYGC